MSEAPDSREIDCPSPQACARSCDLHPALDLDAIEARASNLLPVALQHADTLALVAEARTLRARLAAVETLAAQRDVMYPEKFGRTPTENYVSGYRAARADLRATLRGPR